VARAFASSLLLGLAILSACAPEQTATVEPTADVPAPADEVETERAAEVEDDVASSAGDGSFVVTLGSRCGDTWRGAVLRDGAVRKGADAGRFDVPSASTRELRMFPGEALLLTSPHGGIMALQFDNLSAGYEARVEVTPECSGVKRTLVPAGR
jgi:hypothetical protein